MKRNLLSQNHAQTALEYMLLLMSVVAIVLVGFKTILPSSQQASNFYFDRVAVVIMVKPSICCNGSSDPWEKPDSCCMDFSGSGIDGTNCVQ